MYSPLFVAKKVANTKVFKYPEYKLGVVPKTDIPVVLNLHDAISHHIALIGVTGSGKSFLAREIIREILQDIKIICIDFTGEYEKEMQNLSPQKIDSGNLEEFMKDNNHFAIFELPELSNTSEIITKTEEFIAGIFKFAKGNSNQRICLLLEEAHTIIPESGFLGDLGDFGKTKAIVNKIGQVALQGRKYGVGLMVIGQRTANISKTILTQCNTMVCFQAFDDTNFNFLGNYIGKDMAMTLPTMKKYHAIVAGKALKSDLPLIVDVARNNTNGQISDK